MDRVSVAEDIDRRREFGFADTYQHVDVAFGERTRHGGCSDMLHIRAGQQRKHGAAVLFEGGLREVTKVF